MFEILYSSQGRGYWWRLKATNGEILCHSEVYTSKQSAQKGIEAVKRIGSQASTDDKTI